MDFNGFLAAAPDLLRLSVLVFFAAVVDVLGFVKEAFRLTGGGEVFDFLGGIFVVL